MQNPVRHLFTARLSDRDASLFRALILGERQGIEPETREIFNRTGLGHMLAVSGLHIGLIGWISFFLFTWVLSRSYRIALTLDIRKAAAVLTCFPIVGYTVLSGLQVSGQRAMIMALAFLGAMISDREREIWSTLALAGLLILLLDPNALLSISFQLSFAAVAGILWWMPPLSRKIREANFRTGQKAGHFKETARIFHRHSCRQLCRNDHSSSCNLLLFSPNLPGFPSRESDSGSDSGLLGNPRRASFRDCPSFFTAGGNLSYPCRRMGSGSDAGHHPFLGGSSHGKYLDVFPEFS